MPALWQTGNGLKKGAFRFVMEPSSFAQHVVHPSGKHLRASSRLAVQPVSTQNTSAVWEKVSSRSQETAGEFLVPNLPCFKGTPVLPVQVSCVALTIACGHAENDTGRCSCNQCLEVCGTGLSQFC